MKPGMKSFAKCLCSVIFRQEETKLVYTFLPAYIQLFGNHNYIPALATSQKKYFYGTSGLRAYFYFFLKSLYISARISLFLTEKNLLKYNKKEAISQFTIFGLIMFSSGQGPFLRTLFVPCRQVLNSVTFLGCLNNRP